MKELQEWLVYSYLREVFEIQFDPRSGGFYSVWIKETSTFTDQGKALFRCWNGRGRTLDEAMRRACEEAA